MTPPPPPFQQMSSTGVVWLAQHMHRCVCGGNTLGDFEDPVGNRVCGQCPVTGLDLGLRDLDASRLWQHRRKGSDQL